MGDANSADCHANATGMYQISQSFMDGIYANNEVKEIKFDPHEELLWCISSCGHLCGYYECNLHKVVSVEVPELNKRPTDELYELVALLIGETAVERLIYLLGRSEVLIYSKSGSLHQRVKVASHDDLSCFSHHPNESSSVVLGHAGGICHLDLSTQKVVKDVSFGGTFGAMSLLKYSRGLLCGTDDGQIVTVDLRDRNCIQHSFKPHSNDLCDFTVNSEGYAVVSCGTYQCNQQIYTDQFLKVYDLRYRKAQFPIKVEMQPSFVRFMPVFNDSILLASTSGQYQIANFGQNLLGHPTDEALLLNEYDAVKAIDISSSSRLIAFGTSGGLISLAASSCDDLKINNCSGETVFPSVPPYMAMQPVSFDDPRFVISSSEFAIEPLDKAKFAKLSSDWPQELCSRKYKQINPVDMSLFSQYQSKFKVELIGRKPANWGPVWYPY